jgi:hypothetical protein
VKLTVSGSAVNTCSEPPFATRDGAVPQRPTGGLDLEQSRIDVQLDGVERMPEG